MSLLKGDRKNLVVGLTGGIACGKTTVAEIFRDFGADIVDADLLAHQILKHDSIKKEILKAFGECVLNSEGEIDRSKLGSVVFDSHDSLQSLNEIVHPPVIELMKSQVEQILSSGDHKVVVVIVPLLIETGLTHMVDSVVLVYADKETQIKRLVQRGLSEEDALKRIRSQMPSSEKARFADFIIYNDGSLSDTIRQAREVWKALTGTTCDEDP